MRVGIGIGRSLLVVGSSGRGSAAELSDRGFAPAFDGND